MSILRIDCDATWSTIGWDLTRPPWCSSVRGTTEPILVTPRAALWVPATEPAQPNPLASALLTFLQLPVQPLRGPAYLTGLTADPPLVADPHQAAGPDRPRPLTPLQVRAFTSTLQALLAMPDFLALHAQAGRIAAAWFCPTTTRSFP